MLNRRASYFGRMLSATRSLADGLRITLRHLVAARKRRSPVAIFDHKYFDQPDGIATIQYPHQILPVPVNGRYRLHNEIDDCIVCDKCAKICPVNCIAIEPVRAVEEFGKTSDGTSKRIYAAKFDINMAQCCFCGLCTTVCPTECLTMTKVYDFSVTDIDEHTYGFAEMTEQDVLLKKKEFEEYQINKMAKSASQPSQSDQPAPPKPGSARPVFKPRIKPPEPPPSSSS